MAENNTANIGFEKQLGMLLVYFGAIWMLRSTNRWCLD